MPISLFDPIALGAFKLKNRVFMAPMTRGRSDAQGAPEPYVAEYYAQRAEAGLIITEAVAINARGNGWPGAPGLYTDHHQAGWKRVADAVHEKDGTVFMQLWHMGAAVIPDHIDGAVSNKTAIQFFGTFALSANTETIRPSAAPAQLRPTTRNVAGNIVTSGILPANRKSPPNVDLNSDRPGAVTAVKPVNAAARWGKTGPGTPSAR
ncbi:MAG: hypothetical protein P8H62_12695 [Henriciella sp.]|nr:hypothetical protein [Henriciella sp.]